MNERALDVRLAWRAAALGLLLVAAACRGTPRAPSELAWIQPPGESWEGWTSRAYPGNALGPGLLVESIPTEERWDRWVHMVTTQFLEGAEETPRELMERILARYAERCSALESTVLAEDEASLTYEWWIDACPSAPDQHEVARILRGDHGLHRVAFVARGPRMSPELRGEWLDRLAGARVLERGEAVTPESGTGASTGSGPGTP